MDGADYSLLFKMLSNTRGEGNGTPLQYSCLENPMDRGSWQAAVQGVAKSWTRLSDFTFTFHFHALEKEMATHSCVLAWRIPGTGKPGGLPFTGLHRVRHDWSDLAAAAAMVRWWEWIMKTKQTFVLPLPLVILGRTSHQGFWSLSCVGVRLKWANYIKWL